MSDLLCTFGPAEICYLPTNSFKYSLLSHYYFTSPLAEPSVSDRLRTHTHSTAFWLFAQLRSITSCFNHSHKTLGSLITQLHLLSRQKKYITRASSYLPKVLQVLLQTLYTPCCTLPSWHEDCLHHDDELQLKQTTATRKSSLQYGYSSMKIHTWNISRQILETLSVTLGVTST